MALSRQPMSCLTTNIYFILYTQNKQEHSITFEIGNRIPSFQTTARIFTITLRILDTKELIHSVYSMRFERRSKSTNQLQSPSKGNNGMIKCVLSPS